MKNLFTFLMILSSGHLYSQVAESPFINRHYLVDLYNGKEHDSKQTLLFDSESMTYTEAEQYGFKPESFKWKQKNDSTWTFLSIHKSVKNGVMTWEGKVINNHIEGTCIWTRKVENPVNYTFSGSLLKD